MKEPLIAIVLSDSKIANLLKYELQLSDISKVKVFLSADDFFYSLSKNNIPDFVITDIHGKAETGIDFMHCVYRMISRSNILFLLSPSEEIHASKLMEEGATDFIIRSSQTQIWIREMILNILYLQRSTSFTERERFI